MVKGTFCRGMWISTWPHIRGYTCVGISEEYSSEWLQSMVNDNIAHSILQAIRKHQNIAHKKAAMSSAEHLSSDAELLAHLKESIDTWTSIIHLIGIAGEHHSESTSKKTLCFSNLFRNQVWTVIQLRSFADRYKILCKQTLRPAKMPLHDSFRQSSVLNANKR